MDYEALFAGELDDPIIEMGPSPIAGIHWGVAYERADLAEDPFTPTTWIATEDGWKEIHCQESVAEALRRISFVPRSEDEALAVVRLFLSDCETVLRDARPAYPFPQDIPAEIAERIVPPAVTKKEEGLYEVVLFTYLHDPTVVWFEPDMNDRSVARCTFTVGREVVWIGNKTIWEGR
jgi:hypothetical protein